MSLLGGLTQTIGGMIGGRARRKEQKAANAQMNQRMQAYESFQFDNTFANLGNPAANLSTPAASLSNPAANLTNFAAGLGNMNVGVQRRADGAQNFASQMENTAEDLTVNTQQAEFMAQQQQQGLSNVLGSMRGAAGSSGIAALAQTLAGQQNQNLQAASASIGQQEAANARLAAQQGANIQSAIAGESSQNQAMALQAAQQGASMSQQNQILAAQMGSANQMAGVDIAQQNQILAAQQAQANQRLGAEMGFQSSIYSARGAQDAQTSDFNRQATLLGMSLERKGQADQARADAKSQIIGGIGTMADAGVDAAAAVLGAGGPGLAAALSDRRLKENIKIVGKSKRGFKIYTFEYKDKKYGEGIYQGVMSDEVPRENVIVNQDGYDMVNYSNLDVEFKRV